MLPSIMPPQKNFAEVPSDEAYRRSVFNRTHGHKTTFNSGFLVPFYVDEILPGDTIDFKASMFARISSTLEFPIMDNLFLRTYFFFVPNRLVWRNWERFLGARDTEQTTPDTTEYVLPTIEIPTGAGFGTQSLFDYLGIPPGQHVDESNDVINNLPARCYNKIFNDWFRDENLQDEVEINYLSDGPDDPTDFFLLKKNKRHDYFTSCLPWPQKGDAVEISGQPAYDANVVGTGLGLGMYDGTTYFSMAEDPGGANQKMVSANKYNEAVGTTVTAYGTGGNQINYGITDIEGESGMVAKIQAGTTLTINALRESFTLQRYLELNARGGTRYTEYIEAHFGVKVPDYRLQRAEYLGGGIENIQVNPVSQTTPDPTTPTLQDSLGAQGAYVTMSGQSGFSKSFVEHGYVFGIVCVDADITYQQGLHKMFTRQTRLDFYDPIFANLGEQAVLNQEIYYQDDKSIDEDVFGYQERWAEYRYLPSRISGYFRSNLSSGSSLDAWHLSEDFGSLPALNATFIDTDVPLPRVMKVVSGVPQVIFDSYNRVRQARLMPVYSVPGLRRL
jgi:hypothetical protein